MKPFVRSNVYRPLLQKLNYSPLPVRTRNRKSRRIIRSEAPSEVKPPLTPFWNPVQQTPKYSWTDYESIPSTVPVKKLSARSTTNPSPIIVQVPKDPDGFLQPEHPAAELLSQSALVVVRQLEMMNLFIGFEQANRYRLLSPTGKTVGFLAEEERGLSGTIFRQIAGTHRAFQASIMNQNGQEILRIRRPFSFINSRIFIEAIPSIPGSHHMDDLTSPHEIIGEAQQEFHLWRRKYNLFTRAKPKLGRSDEEYEQFAKIDAGFLSWDFYTQDREGQLTGSVSRNFTGFGREIFTDTGQYVVRFDAIESQVDNMMSNPNSSSSSYMPTPFSTPSLNHLPSTKVHSTGLTLDQRAVMLATAVSIDFDYFSRTHRGGLMPPIFFGGGSSSDDL